MLTSVEKNLRRKQRNRGKLAKRRNVDRPRLVYFGSNKYVYAQIVDDLLGKTLVSASSLEKDVKTSLKSTQNKDAARKVGEVLAERAKKAGVEMVTFDRGSSKYHGRVASLADGARAGGLKF